MTYGEVIELMDIIQRNGEAWQRQPDGSWLRFDMASGMWMPSAVPPPPPPPPPRAGADPYFALPKPARRVVPEVRRLMIGLDRRVLVVALVLLIGLFGIGGAVLLGGDPPAPAAASIGLPENVSKKAKFIRQADAVCAHLVTVMSKMGTPTDINQLVAALRETRNEVWNAYLKLKRLKPPKKVRQEWKRYVGKPGGIRIFDQMVAAAERGDVATLGSLSQELSRKTAKVTKDDRWAKKYGFKVCSQEQLEA